MKFAVIDNNVQPMTPDGGRGLGFIQALSAWAAGSEYEFVRYEDIPARKEDLLQCRGLILSGSRFDLARSDGSFDGEVYQRMAPQLLLIREFTGPVLGVCFGHQLLALGDEFENGCTDFGRVRIRNMRVPQDRYRVSRVCMNRPLRFMEQRDLWAQFNHKQEVVPDDGLRRYYDVIAGSESCPVQIMQHKSRDWYGVQFHPEVGKKTELGEIDQEAAAIRDGQVLMGAFVRYCLR